MKNRVAEGLGIIIVFLSDLNDLELDGYPLDIVH